MLKIASVVILFNPQNNIEENIRSYLDDVLKLIVIDNSPSGFPFSQDFLLHPKVVFIHEPANIGIARSLNLAAELALEEKFHWLLTMDQDSYFLNNDFIYYLQCIEKIKDLSTTGMIGLSYVNNTGSRDSQFETDKLLITSGSLVNLQLFHHLGKFDENLFIDGVDHDYCFKIFSKKLHTVIFKNIILQHSLGNQIMKRSFKSFKNTKRSLHTPVRLYYMTRNFLYLQDKYGSSFPKDLKIIKFDLLNRIKNNLLYGPQRKTTLTLIARAIMDFNKKRFGKLNTQKS